MGFFQDLFKNDQRSYSEFPLHDEGGDSMAEYEDVRDSFGNVISSRRVRDVPWSTTPIKDATPAWKRKKNTADLFLQSCGIKAQVDEIALMFTEEADKIAWIRDAVSEPGVKLFNSAWDTVHTSPIPSRYDVQYDFLEAPGLGMRVEAMRIDRGISPLHQMFEMNHYNPTVDPRSPDFGLTAVHLSFKVKKDEYEFARAAMVSGGAELVQACHSTYGQFAYYRVTNPAYDLGLNLYLKPRINVRDPEPPAAPNTSVRHEDLHADFGHPGVGGRYSADALGLSPVKGRPVRDEPQA